MRLPSSSKSDPDCRIPSLELHLGHSRDTVIKPGHTISGHVEVSTPVAITPQAIEVTFWGKSETWIRTSSSSQTSGTDYYHYRDHAPLFTLTCNVLHKSNSEVLLPSRTYIMPFTFPTPVGTGFNRANCYKHTEEAVWTVSPHQLPPTFFYGVHGPDVPNNCSISYGVTVRLRCPGLTTGKYDSDSIVATAPVLFAPFNPYTHIQRPNRVRHFKKYTFASSILAGQAASSIGFRHSLKDKLSSHTPKLEFELAVELPVHLRSGSEFSFKTTFLRLNKTDNVTQIPVMTFRVLKLELLDFTLFRAPRDWKADNMQSGTPLKDGTPTSLGEREETAYYEDKTLLNSIPNFSTVEIPEVISEKLEKKMEQGSECEAWFMGRVPGFTPPSFQSFAITRTYRIKVKVRLEMGEKHFDLWAEGPEIQMGSA